MVQVFVTWLQGRGESVDTGVAWANVVAKRGAERLVAEVKGITSSPGLDITLYGQLFRRMTDLDGTSYAVRARKARRGCVPRPVAVRSRINIRLFGVRMG